MYTRGFSFALVLNLTALLCCLVNISLSIALPSLELRATSTNTSTPIPPKQDPWYTAPTGYEDTLPGTILRIRPAPGNLTSISANCSATYNVLFRTTNSYSQPAFAVTTVFVPSSNSSSGGSSALLSYQIPYNTADLDGSPSYILYGGVYPDIPAALGQGWIVSVPDFEGPLAAFVMGLTEGRAVLDSIRGVLSEPTFGLSVNETRTALWGYSGGSIASLWAVELQNQYAPELTINGAAIGGTVPSLTASIPLINASPNAGLLPAAFLGITSQSSTARDILKSALFPNNASDLLAATNYPYTQLATIFLGQDILTSYFANYTSFFYAPEIQAIQRDNCHLGYHGVPTMPLFVYKAIDDELAPVEEVDNLVDRWCSLGGVDILYERNRVGDHLGEYYNGVPRARRFLESVLDGTNSVVPIYGGCVVRDVSVSVGGAGGM